MATLTPAAYGKLRRALYQKGAGKEELKALLHLPNKAQFRAALQVLEDFWEANRAQLRNDIVAALGNPSAPNPTLTALAKKIGLAWLRSKLERGG
jgi:hypothetical protein